MTTRTKTAAPAWAWVPPLYYVQGLPYVVIMSVSVAMYNDLGMRNAEVGLYTSLLYLPWVVKPFWSPLVDLTRTKRWWTLVMQALMALGFAGIAAVLHAPGFVVASLALLWVLAFASATHDIAADGFYMLALSEREQALFSGVRSTFYRLAMMSGEGGILLLAAWLATRSGDKAGAWSSSFFVIAAVMVVMALLLGLLLPRPAADRAALQGEGWLASLWETFRAFFVKDNIGIILAFILCYRLGESQLVKMAVPFLRDPHEAGGLALGLDVVGWINGTVGVLALLGGVLAAMHGLRHWLWWMIAAINLPNLAYVLLALWQPDNVYLIASLVGLEKFGYGFGFTAFMLYLIYVSQGSHQTAHYAFCTGFMALGMMLPGMASGWVQEQIGYLSFFVWVLIAGIPGAVIAAFIPLDPAFGKKG